jgi:hypothetical protein
VWGVTYYDKIEQVQRKFCKFILQVPSQTPNEAVLGECGRVPLCTIYMVKAVKFWLKLQKMSNERYPRGCYNMLSIFNKHGKINWVTHIQNIICSTGFGHVWLNQTVGDVNSFISNFKQRLNDMKVQEWCSKLQNCEKLRTYANFKSLLEKEKYLDCIKWSRHRISLTRFRCSAHNLQIELGRRQNLLVENRICNHCLKQNINIVENEYHMLLICSKYNLLRSKYIPENYRLYPTI